MRYLLRFILLAVTLPAWVGTTAADPSAIRIGYVPATEPGPVHLVVSMTLGSCIAGCHRTWQDQNATVPGDDAVAVMAAIDQNMSSFTNDGPPAFGAPLSIPGVTPGEIRYEYPVIPTGTACSGIVSSHIVFDRGAVSLGVVSPCGPDEPDVIGPYTIYFEGRPAAAGTFKLLCQGKPEVDVAVDPSYTARAIADSVYAAAKKAGIDVGQLADGDDYMDDVVINSHKFQQDVAALDYVGMSDGASMTIWIMTNLDWWTTPAERVTWGSVRARYR